MSRISASRDRGKKPSGAKIWRWQACDIVRECEESPGEKGKATQVRMRIGHRSTLKALLVLNAVPYLQIVSTILHSRTHNACLYINSHTGVKEAYASLSHHPDFL